MDFPRPSEMEKIKNFQDIVANPGFKDNLAYLDCEYIAVVYCKEFSNTCQYLFLHSGRLWYV